MSNFYEEFKVAGKDLVEKVKALVHEGNVRRIIVKDESGHTFLEIPLSVAAIGVLAMPILAALGALAALVANFTIVVERVERAERSMTARQPPAAAPPPESHEQ